MLGLPVLALVGGFALTMGVDYARLPLIGAAVAIAAAVLCLPGIRRALPSEPALSR